MASELKVEEVATKLGVLLLGAQAKNKSESGKRIMASEGDLGKLINSGLKFLESKYPLSFNEAKKEYHVTQKQTQRGYI